MEKFVESFGWLILLAGFFAKSIFDYLFKSSKEKARKLEALEEKAKWDAVIQRFEESQRTFRLELKGYFEKMYTIQEGKNNIFEGRLKFLEVRMEETRDEVRVILSILSVDNPRQIPAKEVRTNGKHPGDNGQ